MGEAEELISLFLGRALILCVGLPSIFLFILWTMLLIVNQIWKYLRYGAFVIEFMNWKRSQNKGKNE